MDFKLSILIPTLKSRTNQLLNVTVGEDYQEFSK